MSPLPSPTCLQKVLFSLSRFFCEESSFLPKPPTPPFFSSGNKVKIDARGSLAGERCQRAVEEGEDGGRDGPLLRLYSWRLTRLKVSGLCKASWTSLIYTLLPFSYFPLPATNRGWPPHPQQQNNPGLPWPTGE